MVTTKLGKIGERKSEVIAFVVSAGMNVTANNRHMKKMRKKLNSGKKVQI